MTSSAISNVLKVHSVADRSAIAIIKNLGDDILDCRVITPLTQNMQQAMVDLLGQSLHRLIDLLLDRFINL